MKHIVKRILSISLFLTALAGCSGDKPETIKYPIEKNIIGKWYLAGFDAGNGYVDYNNPCKENRDYLEFLENGNCSEQGFNKNCESAYSFNGKWTVALTSITMNNSEEEKKSFNVIQLSGSDLAVTGGGIKGTSYYAK